MTVQTNMVSIPILVALIFYLWYRNVKITKYLTETCRHCQHSYSNHYTIMQSMSPEELGPGPWCGTKSVKVGCSYQAQVGPTCSCAGFESIANVDKSVLKIKEFINIPNL